MSPRAWQTAAPPLVLASGSATRRALLEAVGLQFDIVAPEINEATVRLSSERQGRRHDEIAVELAERKASHVSRLRPDAVVIGADQILSARDTMWSKPADLIEARRQLAELQGQVQILQTAVVLARHGQIVWRHLASPRITMRRSSDALLDLYVAAEGEALLQTVGACRVEGPGQLLFERIEGEQAAILGLPLLALLAELRRLGLLIA